LEIDDLRLLIPFYLLSGSATTHPIYPLGDALMTITINADPVPLHVDAHGTVRVAGMRLTLDTVIALYRQGRTAEEIQRSFDGLLLADIHAVIAYYLHHQAELDAYLAERARIGEEIRRDLEARQGPSPLRQRLSQSTTRKS
jgi:uncharacterized protein (DUF433 family)